MSEVVKPRAIEAKTIVKQSSLGHPMVHLADENINKVIAGRIIGIATGISVSSVEDRETGEIKQLKSLTGNFKAIPRDEKKAITVSAKLGLPLHIIGAAIAALEAGKDTGNVSVSIALDLGVERAGNATGYSWYGISLIPEGEGNPLAMLEKSIASGSLPAPAQAAAIEGPSAEAVAEIFDGGKVETVDAAVSQAEEAAKIEEAPKVPENEPVKTIEDPKHGGKKHR